jgi:hypothetical protein
VQKSFYKNDIRNLPEGMAVDKVVIFVPLCNSTITRRKTGKFNSSIIGNKAMAGCQELELFI